MKNYLYLTLVLVVLLASCGNDKTKETTTTEDTTATKKTPPPPPNQPEITEIAVSELNKNAVLKFKLPQKENVSISVTDVNGVGLVSEQIEDANGEMSHTIDFTKYPRIKKGLFYVYVVTHKGNLKARKEMILK
ncbi:MAG TPA: hypothetical protein DCS93_12560 [Microscillaceae bacterium]|nr:hypothetical protein [Microscillaceae bacterium]